ncbi:MAG: tRNA pseudouridine(55) synthase TruB [Eubacteriales bacterium]|jgi:tRNA pseudouridine55 synthase
MDGIVNVNKQAGMTSFDVVFHCRKIFDTRKIGHTGTLDPMATGVLPVCVGKGTKLVEFLMADDKVYTATLQLGLVTDTQDSTGQVLSRNDRPVPASLVRETVQSFVGDSLQVPPMYSAIKVSGQKLVDLARKGVEIPREARPVTIYAIDMVEEDPQARRYVLRVHCKKGTYIRSLCHDIGQRLGVGGVMASLHRNRSGVFDETTAVTLDELRAAREEGRLEQLLLPVESAFRDWEKLVVDSRQEELIRHGVRLALSRLQIGDDERPVAVYNERGELLMAAEKLWEADSLRQLRSFY